MKPIKISVDGDFKQKGKQQAEIECDDAIVIYSKINGAVLGTAKTGEPVFTRDVSTWVGGFSSMPDVYTRLSQGILQLFMSSKNERVNQYNIVNLIQFLINNGGLSDDVRLSISEGFVSGKEREKNEIM